MTNKAMTKLGLIAIGVLLTTGLACASEEGELPSANTTVSNISSLQRGSRLFFNYCVGCHSLKFMRYSRIGEDLELSESEVMHNLNFTGAKFGETVQASMRSTDAQVWFGKAPPDLSLEARSKGPDWIYNYLKSFYVDPTRPVGWNNTVFPNASMPNVLWELQGVQKAEFVTVKEGEPGHEMTSEKLEKFVPVAAGKLNAEQYDQAARDLTAFLQYVGEPAALKRQSMGVWVLLYLALFTFIAWLLKHEYWKDVH